MYVHILDYLSTDYTTFLCSMYIPHCFYTQTNSLHRSIVNMPFVTRQGSQPHSYIYSAQLLISLSYLPFYNWYIYSFYQYSISWMPRSIYFARVCMNVLYSVWFEHPTSGSLNRCTTDAYVHCYIKGRGYRRVLLFIFQEFFFFFIQLYTNVYKN